MTVLAERARPLSPRERTLAQLSFRFLLHQMISGIADLDPLDALLVLAINQANIAPLTRDPAARALYGQLQAPAPDDERRPVSINAVAASLGLPFETVRRRIKRLAALGVCVSGAEGVVVPASFLSSPRYLESVMAAHGRLRRLFLDLRAGGLADDLPASGYSLEEAVPVRAAARLTSDYVLRICESLMRLSGSVVSLLVLVALLTAALGRGQGGVGPGGQTVSTLAALLRLPAETVRRHVAILAEQGFCLRTPKGIVMPQEALSRPDLRLLLADNANHMHRLLTGLAERGVILAWDAGPDEQPR